MNEDQIRQVRRPVGPPGPGQMGPDAGIPPKEAPARVRSPILPAVPWDYATGNPPRGKVIVDPDKQTIRFEGSDPNKDIVATYRNHAHFRVACCVALAQFAAKREKWAGITPDCVKTLLGDKNRLGSPVSS